MARTVSATTFEKWLIAYSTLLAYGRWTLWEVFTIELCWIEYLSRQRGTEHFRLEPLSMYNRFLKMNSLKFDHHCMAVCTKLTLKESFFFQQIAATNAAVIIASGPAPGYSISFEPNVSNTPPVVIMYARFVVRFSCTNEQKNPYIDHLINYILLIWYMN